MKAIDVVRAALAYAHDNTVREQVVRTLKALDTDAEDVGFQSSAGLDAEVKELEARMDEFDERVATVRMRAASADTSEEDEEG